MRSRRARRVFGTLSLVFVGGCVALTGIGDLSVDTDSDGGLPVGTINLGDGSARLPDGHVIPIGDGGFPFFDGNFFDVFGPPADGGLNDGGADTGPIDSGTGSNPSVACNNLTCNGAKPVCCYAASDPIATCSAAPGQCPILIGFPCDDDTDCAKGNVCCVRSNIVVGGASSQCATSCTGGSMRACSSDQYCGTLGLGSCTPVQFAPSTIRGCAAASTGN